MGRCSTDEVRAGGTGQGVCVFASDVMLMGQMTGIFIRSTVFLSLSMCAILSQCKHRDSRSIVMRTATTTMMMTTTTCLAMPSKGSIRIRMRR